MGNEFWKKVDVQWHTKLEKQRYAYYSTLSKNSTDLHPPVEPKDEETQTLSSLLLLLLSHYHNLNKSQVGDGELL